MEDLFLHDAADSSKLLNAAAAAGRVSHLSLLCFCCLAFLFFLFCFSQINLFKNVFDVYLIHPVCCFCWITKRTNILLVMLAGTNGLFSLLFAVEAVKMLTWNMKLKKVSDSANGSYAILLTAFSKRTSGPTALHKSVKSIMPVVELQSCVRVVMFVLNGLWTGPTKTLHRTGVQHSYGNVTFALFPAI